MLVNEGKIHLMDCVNGLQFPGGFKMGVFDVNYTVIAATTAADVPQAANTNLPTLTGPTGGVLVAGPRGQSTYNPITITNSGGTSLTLYGWFVIDVTWSNFWAAGNFATPIVLAAGASTTLNPYAQDDTL
jgi:hypothetical protein